MMAKNNTTDTIITLPSLLTIREVAHVLKVHTNTVKRWADEGILRVYRIGNKKERRFHPDDINSFLHQEKTGDQEIRTEYNLTTSPKIFIISKQPLIRSAIRQTLGRTESHQSDITEFGSTESSEASLKELKPNVILCGADMTSEALFRLRETLNKLMLACRIIILTPDTKPEEIIDAFNTALSCVRKCGSVKCLGTMILEQPSFPVEQLPEPLTTREQQILDLITVGVSTNKKIAEALRVSEQTIKNQTVCLIRKLNANDRAHAMVQAMRYRLISLDERELSSIDLHRNKRYSNISTLKINLTDTERTTLQALIDDPKTVPKTASRVKIILALDSGLTSRKISSIGLGSGPTILRWRKKYLEQGLDGLSNVFKRRKRTVPRSSQSRGG